MSHLTTFENEPDRNHAWRSVSAHRRDARQMTALAQKFSYLLIRKLWHSLPSLANNLLAAEDRSYSTSVDMIAKKLAEQAEGERWRYRQAICVDSDDLRLQGNAADFRRFDLLISELQDVWFRVTRERDPRGA